jgi:hypothetical protein
VPGRERRRRIEAFAYLLAARIALRVLPFRWLTPIFEREPRVPELEGPERDEVRAEVRRAIHRTARLLPGTACFPKAIAAQAMLRRRAVATTLYCGAARIPGEGLVTHVWLQDGDVGVAGHRVSRDYEPLAQYSAHTSKTRSAT